MFYAITTLHPSPFKEPALADLRGGMPIKDVVKKYNLCERTVYYYLQEVKSESTFITGKPYVTPGLTNSQPELRIAKTIRQVIRKIVREEFNNLVNALNKERGDR